MRLGGGDETHAGRGGAPRRAGADRPAGQGDLSTRSQNVAKERQELAGRLCCKKELQSKKVNYQVRSNRKFFDVEPMAAKIKELNAENQQLHDKITELKSIRHGAGQG
eukprot:3953749-Pleurochrysis_carterae.AAC.1